MIPRRYDVIAALAGLVGAGLVWLGWWLGQTPCGDETCTESHA